MWASAPTLRYAGAYGFAFLLSRQLRKASVHELLQAHQNAELCVVPRQAALEIDRVGFADGAVGGQLNDEPCTNAPAAITTSAS